MTTPPRKPVPMKQDGSRLCEALRQGLAAATPQPIRCICGARPAADGTIPCDH